MRVFNELMFSKFCFFPFLYSLFRVFCFLLIHTSFSQSRSLVSYHQNYVIPYSGRGDQSKGGRGAHGFGNEGQEALEAQKDPASANPDVEGQEEIAAEPVVEAEPEPGKSSHDA